MYLSMALLHTKISTNLIKLKTYKISIIHKLIFCHHWKVWVILIDLQLNSREFHLIIHLIFLLPNQKKVKGNTPSIFTKEIKFHFQGLLHIMIIIKHIKWNQSNNKFMTVECYWLMLHRQSFRVQHLTMIITFPMNWMIILEFQWKAIVN